MNLHIDDSSETVKRLMENPESVLLFRGERLNNQGGLHFTTDKKWAEHFGTIIRTGKLPIGSKVKLLKEADMDDALGRGIVTEQGLWDLLFEQGYDAILGHDAMNHLILDIIVHPKHLGRFEIWQPQDANLG